VVMKLVKGGFNPLVISEISFLSEIGLPAAASWFAKLLAVSRNSEQVLGP
jgi:hypothetical protein